MEVKASIRQAWTTISSQTNKRSTVEKPGWNISSGRTFFFPSSSQLAIHSAPKHTKSPDDGFLNLTFFFIRYPNCVADDITGELHHCYGHTTSCFQFNWAHLTQLIIGNSLQLVQGRIQKCFVNISVHCFSLFVEHYQILPAFLATLMSVGYSKYSTTPSSRLA